jgi:hypothetical protein
MKSTQGDLTMSIDNTDDIIDSRDIIERIEELAGLVDEIGEGEHVAEWKVLTALAKQGEAESRDWLHGETLIRRSYFVDYISDLIHDCYEMPKEMTSGNWPFRHITIDYEAAAQEAEQDYASVYFDGEEYLIRSC